MSKYLAKLQPAANNILSRTADLYIYDVIDPWWGVSAQEVVDSLADMDLVKGDKLNVFVNSPGGSITEGFTIFSLLRRTKATVVTYNDGLAASMGSVLFMAGDKRIVTTTAFTMIHNPWTFTGGESADLRHDADLMDKMKDMIINSAYMLGSTKTVEELSDMMDVETWLTPEEALEAGFATHIEERAEETELVNRSKWENKGFNKIPFAALSFFEEKPLLKAELKNILNNNSSNNATPTNKGSNNATPSKGDTFMDANTFKAEHPEEYASIQKEGATNAAQAEQSRIKSIEDLAKSYSNATAAVKVAINAHITSVKFDASIELTTTMSALMDIANTSTGKHVKVTAEGKRAQAEIAADIPEGETESDGSGDDDADKKEAEDKAVVASMVSGAPKKLNKES